MNNSDYLNKLSKVNFLHFISKDDPTRFNKNIATNPNNFIKPAEMLYKLTKSKERLTVYWYSPIRLITGNSYTCPVISKAFLTPKENTIKIILNVGSNYFISGNNVFLCPGTFKDSSYISMSLDNYLTITNDINSYLSPLSYRWNTSESDDILPYLIDFHTRRVQRGYYSNEYSTEYQVFLDNGTIFRTEGKSYYENLDSNEDIDITLLPFYEYPSDIKLKLYSKSSFNQVEGELMAPLLLSIVETEDYSKKLYVDLQLIDLNFTWKEKHRNKDEKISSVGCYSLSPEDSTYLEYFTHNPASLVVVYGHVRGNMINVNIK